MKIKFTRFNDMIDDKNAHSFFLNVMVDIIKLSTYDALI